MYRNSLFLIDPLLNPQICTYSSKFRLTQTNCAYSQQLLVQIIRCWRFLGGEIGVGLAARPEGFKAARLVGLKISYRFLGLNRALQGALNVHSMCTPCALHVHSMCTPCALHVHSMCTPCALHVHSMWERERESGGYIYASLNMLSQYLGLIISLQGDRVLSVSTFLYWERGRQGFIGLNISLLGERETGF